MKGLDKAVEEETPPGEKPSDDSSVGDESVPPEVQPVVPAKRKAASVAIKKPSTSEPHSTKTEEMLHLILSEIQGLSKRVKTTEKKLGIESDSEKEDSGESEEIRRRKGKNVRIDSSESAEARFSTAEHFVEEPSKEASEKEKLEEQAIEGEKSVEVAVEEPVEQVVREEKSGEQAMEEERLVEQAAVEREQFEQDAQDPFEHSEPLGLEEIEEQGPEPEREEEAVLEEPVQAETETQPMEPVQPKPRLDDIVNNPY